MNLVKRLFASALLGLSILVLSPTIDVHAWGGGYSGTETLSSRGKCPGFYTKVKSVKNAATSVSELIAGTKHSSSCYKRHYTNGGSCSNGGGITLTVATDGGVVNWIYKTHVCWKDGSKCGYGFRGSCANRYGYKIYRCDYNSGHTWQDSSGSSVYCSNSPDKQHHLNHEVNGVAKCSHCNASYSSYGKDCEVNTSWTSKFSYNNTCYFSLNGVNGSKSCTSSDNRVIADYDSTVQLNFKYSSSDGSTIITAYEWRENGSKIVGSGGNTSVSTSSYPDITLVLPNVTTSDNYYQLRVYLHGVGWSEWTGNIYVDTTMVVFDYSPEDGIANNEGKHNRGFLLDRKKSPNTAITEYKVLIPKQPYGALPGDKYSDLNDIHGDNDAIVSQESLYLYRTVTLNPRGRADGKTYNNYKVLMPSNTDAYKNALVYDNNNTLLDVNSREYFLSKVYDFNSETTTKTYSGKEASENSESNTSSSRWDYTIYAFSRFQGWFLDKSYTPSKQITSTTSVTTSGKHYAYAKWNHDVATDVQLPIPKREFTLNYNLNGGVNVEDNKSSIVASKYYFEFDGWGTSPDTNSQSENVVTNDSEVHTHIGSTTNGGAGTCYTKPNYHYHSGNAAVGTGCYTVGVAHVHTGNSISGGGCYNIPVYHVHEGDEENGGACFQTSLAHAHIGSTSLTGTNKGGAETCYETPVYHQHTGSTALTGTNKGGSGTCYATAVYHAHAGSSSAKSGCYTVPVYHKHTGSSTSGGGCYGTPVYHSHVTSCYKTCGQTCSYQWVNFTTNPWVDAWGIICPTHHIVSAAMNDKEKEQSIERNGKNPKCTRSTLICGKTAGSTIEGYSLSCGKTAGTTIDYYDLGCGMTPSTQLSWKLSCTKTPGTTQDSWALSCTVPLSTTIGFAQSCTLDESAVQSWNLGCNLSGTSASYNLGCGKVEGQTVEYWTFTCEESTSAVSSGLLNDNIITPTEILNLQNNAYIPEAKELVLYGHWSEGAQIQLPEVKKPGYEFIGWYTVPQAIQNSSALGNSVYDKDAQYPEEEYVTDDGVTRKTYAGGGFQRDATFIEESVNLDNPNNSVTLYAWFNRTPIFSDIYEGLFFEGQKVSLQDLTRLVGVFDWEDDYYNEAVKKVYALPEIKREDMYVDIVIDRDNTYGEDEDSTDLDGDIDEVINALITADQAERMKQMGNSDVEE